MKNLIKVGFIKIYIVENYFLFSTKFHMDKRHFDNYLRLIEDISKKKKKDYIEVGIQYL